MDLLDFARGPALTASIAILLAGVSWRLAAIALLSRRPDHSEARGAGFPRGLAMIFTRMWPRREFAAGAALDMTLGYVFHIGLAVVVFAFLPHILFIESMTGLSWPHLPNGAVYFAGAVTTAALVGVLVTRLANPVRRLLSGFDDYASWAITLAPVVTGLLAAAHVGARYETLLAVHLLSVELLFVWFPFGKLMHGVLVFVSRGHTGMLLARKGATW